MPKIRVVIIDDSPTMRALVAAKLAPHRDIEVVGMASDPYEAREVIKRVNPDVLTLDIEMPRMDGLTFLDKLMRLRPTPTIMVSTLTSQGASSSVAAMALGAFDVVCKPSDRDPGSLDALPEMVRAAATSQPVGMPQRQSHRRKSVFSQSAPPVFIGSSTGGVEALSVLLSEYGETCPPTLVVQHMPAGYTESLAHRLNDLCPANVVEAEDNVKLESGTVYIAKGGNQHMTVARRDMMRIRTVERDPVNGHRPSVDVLFESAVKALGGRAVGVLLTGMGNDGAKGLLALREAGAVTIAQDRQSCVVYGMPRAAMELGAVDHQVHINAICRQIEAVCKDKSLRQAS